MYSDVEIYLYCVCGYLAKGVYHVTRSHSRKETDGNDVMAKQYHHRRPYSRVRGSSDAANKEVRGEENRGYACVGTYQTR